MNFRFYHEKLTESDEYKEFMKKNPKAYPCSCFFVLDREKSGADNRVHFDFLIPETKKMHSFKVNDKVELLDVENYDERPFEEISVDYNFNLEDFEKMIFQKLQEEKINGRIQKLLFSLQKLNGKSFLIVTGFLNNLGLIKTTISLDEMKIITFEKKSFFDMMKIMRGKGKNNKEDGKN